MGFAELYFPYPRGARRVQLSPMKFPPLFLVLLRRWGSLGLFAALALVGAGCSSNESPATLQVQPSMPSGPAGPGEPSTPDGTYGLPGPEPMSTPPENDGPGATETNFLTPPCRQDSDCNGRRCIFGARGAGEADAGAASADAGDAGRASDAGVDLGFCERPDAG